MEDLLNNPAVQAGVAPLIVALVVGAALARTRIAWFAIVAGYATMIALSTGFSFSPLSASRKVTLLILLAPLLGLALDLAVSRRAALAATGIGLAAGAAAVWSFWSVLSQRDFAEAAGVGALVFAAAGATTWLTLRLRGNGVALGAAGLGLGLATGIGALLSASSGYFMAGIALAAGAGALLLVQLARSRAILPGFTGALSVGIAAALFASASMMIAQLPWYALVLVPLIPAAAALTGLEPDKARGRGRFWLRAAITSAFAIAAAALPVLAAWYATQGP